MNCPVEYDDASEARRTHPMLLPKAEDDGGKTHAVAAVGTGVPKGKTADGIVRSSAQPARRRSVLGDVRVAKARLWLLRNTKWGESARRGERTIPWARAGHEGT